MMSALFHDIGHVPFSHAMEKKIDTLTGRFGHEANGGRVFQEICRYNNKSISRV